MQYKEYTNQGYEHNLPSYIIKGLEFICTCSSFPEQYDVVYNTGEKRYQVGYVRLRHGTFRVIHPDCTDDCILYKSFDNHMMGVFEEESSRLEHLQKAAEEIRKQFKVILTCK